MNRLSLSNNRLKFKTSGKLSIILEEAMEYTSSDWSETGRSHVGLGNTRILTDYVQRSPWTLGYKPYHVPLKWRCPIKKSGEQRYNAHIIPEDLKSKEILESE